jgi:hypothetical protein
LNRLFPGTTTHLSAKPTETPTFVSSPSTKVQERTVMAILLNHLDLPVYKMEEHYHQLNQLNTHLQQVSIIWSYKPCYGSSLPLLQQ